MLAAWGGLIQTRPYRPQMLDGIVSVSDASGCDWASIGDLLASGHPRRPSRAGYDRSLQSFDLREYRNWLT